MNLDMIGAIGATAIFVGILGFVVGFSRLRITSRLLVFAIAAVWMAMIVTVTMLGAFAPGALGRFPSALLPFFFLTAALCGSFVFLARVRSELLAIPLPVLVVVNAGRIGGVFFLLLYGAGRITAPFAPSAGIGDILTGIFALLLTWRLIGNPGVKSRWIRYWNMFGLMDLASAITLGTLSAPGSLFPRAPGTSVMSFLPWSFVPSILVPVYILLHLVIAKKIKTMATVETVGRSSIEAQPLENF